MDSTKTLIHAFVTSHLDYCNSLLAGIPQYQLQRLQKVLNAAARLIHQISRHSHITPILIPVFTGCLSNFESILKLLYWSTKL